MYGVRVALVETKTRQHVGGDADQREIEVARLIDGYALVVDQFLAGRKHRIVRSPIGLVLPETGDDVDHSLEDLTVKRARHLGVRPLERRRWQQRAVATLESGERERKPCRFAIPVDTEVSRS